MGLSRLERRAYIYGEFCDLIACYQIERGAKQKLPFDDETEIPDLL